MKVVENLEKLRELLLDNIPRSIERLSKARGPSQTLPNLSEAKLTNLIYDIMTEMKARRPHNFSETEHPFLADNMLLNSNASGSTWQIGKEWLKNLALNDFELLCYEVCIEIDRRYLTRPNLSEVHEKLVARPTTPKNHLGKKWQICNAMDGDWSDSDISFDEGTSEEEEPPSSLSDMSDKTILDEGQNSEEQEESMSEKLNLVCSRLMRIFQDRSRYKLLLGYRDLEAQAILDLLQNLLDSPQVQSSKLKKELAVAIQRLSKKSALYPECFVLKDISIEKNSDGSIHTLSSGKFGDVWRGSMQGQHVCLKVMRVYRNSKLHELLKIFSCEAVLWGQLRHTNVLPFYGVYRLDHPSHSRICLVSPWMQNGNVDEYLSREHNVNRLSLISDVAAGLRYLHAQNIVHGDLKGANVLVNSAGRACLADFGLSTIRDPEVLALSTTGSATCGGTVRWMAPELLSSYDDEPINTKESDIYAFAGVCYEIFTGHVPFYEVFRDQTVILKVNRGELPSRPDHEDCLKYGLSEPIWRLMQDCWVNLPGDRPIASEIIVRLSTIRKIARKSKLARSRTPSPGRSTPTRNSRLPPALQKDTLLSPNLFRASFLQAANLENQLKRKDLLKLLDVSTEPLLDYS